MKIVWKVADVLTGPYRSFHERGWPSAFYDDSKKGPICAKIYCSDDYTATIARSGDHAPLRLCVADHSTDPAWKWKTVKQRFATLADAKEGLVSTLGHFPELIPTVSK